MLIISPSTIWNPRVLQMQAAPKRMLRRVTLIPRKRIGIRMWLRLIFEVQILRYLIPLLPFVAAMFLWPRLALPISQAPVPMLIVIAIFETRVLSIKREKRAGLIDDADMARAEDALRFNATRLLQEIAARRALEDQEIMLVVEQSTLARVAPLTLVSVQEVSPRPQVLDLDEEETALLQNDLFDGEFTEQLLHRVTVRRNENLYAITFDSSTLSAHARIAATVARKHAPAAQSAETV